MLDTVTGAHLTARTGAAQGIGIQGALVASRGQRVAASRCSCTSDLPEAGSTAPILPDESSTNARSRPGPGGMVAAATSVIQKTKEGSAS